jgi:superfamily I DNA/RNA helicase
MERTAYLEQLSGETLDVFSEIESKAKHNLKNLPSGSAEVLANPNTFTDANTQLGVSRQENQQSYKHLVDEPAIARLRVEDEEGNISTVYMCRAAALSLDGGVKLAGYSTGFGRLAALSVGDSETIKVGEKLIEFTVIESTQLRPINDNCKWDSKHTIFQHEELGTTTVTSLRRLLEEPQRSIEEKLAALLEGEKQDDNIKQGIVHQIRSAMSLRDQPILDKIQDEIFRLPLDSQLIILGPPGTGKTTTLIKRLGQKINQSFLDQAEQAKVQRDITGLPHEQSWLLFTPTELLKHYVKEAFGREKVPVTNERIRTWDSTRSDLARNTLGLLQSGNSKGKFNYKKDLVLLSSELIADPRDWVDEITSYHENRLRQQLLDGVERLSAIQVSHNADLISRIAEVIDNSSGSLVSLYEALIPLEDEIRPLLDAENQSAEESLHQCLVALFKEDNLFLQKLADRLNETPQEEEQEDDDAFDEEADDFVDTTVHTPQTAAKEYTKALKAIARQKFLGRSLSKKSRSFLIKEWLGEQRIPSDDVLEGVGRQMVTINGLRRFLNAHRRYVADIATSYKQFRKNRQNDQSFYQLEPSNSRQITAQELDAVIFLTLRNTHHLVSKNFVQRRWDRGAFGYLKQVAGSFRNQILVDEATDFSVVQLACMKHLASPQTQSFFACGDFNQSITSEGIHKQEQLAWISNKLNKRTIKAVYRQSQKLNEFAKHLLAHVGGDEEAVGELPENYNHQGVAPALVENVDDFSSITKWLSQRIVEVEKELNGLPSIAVLVNQEEDVKPLADALEDELEIISANVEPCMGGKSLGENTDIRVFSVEHIKGLEFEAVFFVGVDQLSNLKPDLFAKYLYVGVTRAASYLGMTCNGVLPEHLDYLRDQCVQSWT